MKRYIQVYTGTGQRKNNSSFELPNVSYTHPLNDENKWMKQTMSEINIEWYL